MAAPWFTKLEVCLAESSGRISSTWAQLSTIRAPATVKSELIDLSGRPANRTINIRSTTESALRFVSDTRSGKALDVTLGTSKTSEFGELCWFFPECFTQFRISGKIHILKRGILREDTWKELNDSQKEWWAYPPPGSARTEDTDGVRHDTTTIPAHFCVCEIQPDYVEVFDQRPAPMLREQYHLVGKEWKSKLVYP